jgi:hypothetical protein
MSDLREKIAKWLKTEEHQYNEHAGEVSDYDRENADEIISMVLSEAIKAINANVSIETGDRYNAIEDAICIIERLK